MRYSFLILLLVLVFNCKKISNVEPKECLPCDVTVWARESFFNCSDSLIIELFLSGTEVDCTSSWTVDGNSQEFTWDSFDENHLFICFPLEEGGSGVLNIGDWYWRITFELDGQGFFIVELISAPC